MRQVLAEHRELLLAEGWTHVLRGLGYSLSDPHLRDTPGRVARFLHEWHTNGSEPPKMTVFPSAGCDEVVAMGGIRFYSLCAHHGLPFSGTAAVGYLPGKSIVGLSKLARVVDHFSRRFQVQERLTRDIADYLGRSLKPRGVGVVLRAEHYCMSMRGIQKPGHFTVTSEMRGVFRRKPEARAELLSLVG